MQIKSIPKEDKRNLAILREKIAVLRRESDEAYLIASNRRQELSEAVDKMSLIQREIAIKVGGTTNWRIDEDGAHLVLIEFNERMRY